MDYIIVTTKLGDSYLGQAVSVVDGRLRHVVAEVDKAPSRIDARIRVEGMMKGHVKIPTIGKGRVEE